MWGATYCWKALNEGYNFSLNHTSIGSLQKTLWAPKIARIPTWDQKQNDIWVQAPWLGTKNIIMGKVMASPKFRSL